MNQRELAVDILYKTIKDESYSNLLMRNELNKIEPIQRAFVTSLVNGVLRKYEFLNYQFKNDLNSSTSLRVRIILCCALFERFMFKERDYVVNNEYTELGKNKYEKAFINAILRKINLLKETNIAYVKYCLPEWIYNLLSSQYNETDLLNILDVYANIPKVYYHLNTARHTYEELKDYDIEIIDFENFTCKSNLLNTPEYKKGVFYVQDLNSASLYRHLDLKPDNTLLDVCSAPGSKLFNCLSVLNPLNCYANDLHEKRVDLIRKMAYRLGYDGINFLNYDGCQLVNHLNMKFDRIMLDVPCSGLGVIGRKPDLKFHIEPTSLDDLQVLQLKLLEANCQLLKNEGIMLYSTCTLNKKENSKNIIKFLSKHPDFILLEEETIINEFGDCFYYAKLKKVQ